MNAVVDCSFYLDSQLGSRTEGPPDLLGSVGNARVKSIMLQKQSSESETSREESPLSGMPMGTMRIYITVITPNKAGRISGKPR